MLVCDKQRYARGYLCQEADQHLQSAKKNTPGSRDNGIKQSEGINGNKRRLLGAAWTRWLKLRPQLQSRTLSTSPPSGDHERPASR
jgi:hypothetical protein